MNRGQFDRKTATMWLVIPPVAYVLCPTTQRQGSGAKKNEPSRHQSVSGNLVKR